MVKAKRQQRLIRTEKDRREAVALIVDLDLDEPQEMILRPFKRNRSVAQNNLYRKWCQEIGDHLGVTAEFIHRRFKKNFLPAVYYNDIQDFPEFERLFKLVKALQDDGNHELAEELKEATILSLSTTLLNTAQMSVYMLSCKKWTEDTLPTLTLTEPDDKWMMI